MATGRRILRLKSCKSLTQVIRDLDTEEAGLFGSNFILQFTYVNADNPI